MQTLTSNPDSIGALAIEGRSHDGIKSNAQHQFYDLQRTPAPQPTLVHERRSSKAASTTSSKELPCSLGEENFCWCWCARYHRCRKDLSQERLDDLASLLISPVLPCFEDDQASSACFLAGGSDQRCADKRSGLAALPSKRLACRMWLSGLAGGYEQCNNI